MTFFQDGGKADLPLDRFHSPEEEKLDLFPETSPWQSPTDTWLDGVDHENISKTEEEDGTSYADSSMDKKQENAVEGRDVERSQNSPKDPNNTSVLSREHDSDSDFIQDDDDYDDDMEDELEAWDRVDQLERVVSSAGRARPDSAMHGRRGASFIHSAPVSRRRLDAEEERELRIEAIFPCFASVFRPLVTNKLAVGGSKVLLQYIERGYPEYCVEAIENGVRSLTKIASKDASSMAEASYRLVVIGNYCASLLMRTRQLQHAQQILKKLQVLTSGHTGEFRRKSFFRVWTLCNLGILHTSMGMPVVGYEYLESALDHVDRNNHRGGQLVFALVRCAFFCGASQFERAKGDATFASNVLLKMRKDGATQLGPAPNSAWHHLSMVMSYNRALALLCCAAKDVESAKVHAQEAWREARNAEPDQLSLLEAEDRRQVLRLRDTLARDTRDPLQQEYINAVRAASLTPGVAFQPSAKALEAMSWSRGSLKRAELARAGSAKSKGGSPEKEGRDGEETSERAEQEEGAREGGEGRLMREVRSAVDWKRVNGRMREQHNQPTLAESSAETLRGLLNRLKEAVDKEQKQNEEGDDELGTTESGVPPGWQEAYRRHIRSEWLVHAPVLAVSISKMLLDFLKSLDSFFAANKFGECLEEVERLVEHVDVPAVVEALGESSERDVCICLCSAFVKFAIACSSKGNVRDAEAFYCYGMTVADRGPVSGIRGLLRAWMFDSMAFGHYKSGNFAMALAALDAALKELRGTPRESATPRGSEGEDKEAAEEGSVEKPGEMLAAELNEGQEAVEEGEKGEGGEGKGEKGPGRREGGVREVGCKEMEIVIHAHRVEVLLKMARWMDALERGLDLFRELQAAPPFLFPAAVKGQVSTRPDSAANRLRRQAGMEMSGPGYRLGGGDMGLFVPVTSLTANHDILRRRRTAPRIVAHSRKYIHAHVAHLTAAAAASLGREDDAKSLFRFAKKAGESAVVEQLAGTERGEKARRGGSFKRSVPASSPGGSGWDGEAGVVGADSLQRQVDQASALLDFTSREGAPPMSGAPSQILLLATSTNASRPPSATPSRVPSRAPTSRPPSAYARPGSAMQDRLSAAAPRGSTARLLSRPKSAIAPGSPSAAVKTAGPKRPASALGIASVPSEAPSSVGGASSTDWALCFSRREVQHRSQQQMREWDPRPPRMAGMSRVRPGSAVERPASAVAHKSRPGSAVDRARPSSAVARPGSALARPGSAVIRRIYG